MILGYYSIFSIFLILGADIFSDGYSGGINLNATGELTSSEVDTGGLFNTGVDFGRFFFLITLGIGLPSSLPSWFILLFAFWQTIVTALSVGFIISSIWDG